MRIVEQILDLSDPVDEPNFNHVIITVQDKQYDVSFSIMDRELRHDLCHLFNKRVDHPSKRCINISWYNNIDRKYSFNIELSGINRLSKVWAGWYYLRERKICV